MNKLEYQPGTSGQAAIPMDGPSAFVGTAEELRSRKWDYELGYRDLMNAVRPAREVSVNFASDYEIANALRRVADADVAAGTPGTFVAQGEWRQRGYILEANHDSIHFGRLSTDLTVALLDGAWWRVVQKSFFPDVPQPTPAPKEYRTQRGKAINVLNGVDTFHELDGEGYAKQDGTPTPDSPVEIQVVRGHEIAGQTGRYIDLVVTHDGVTTTTPIPLPSKGWAGALPDGTADTLTIDSAGHVEWTSSIGMWNMREFANLNNWNKSGSAINGFYIAAARLSPLAKTPGYGRLYCSCAKSVNTVNEYFRTINSVFIDGSFNFNLDPDVVGSTLEDFKAWLADNDMYMLAQLATTTTETANIQLPEFPEGATVSIPELDEIGVTWEVVPGVNLDYPYDYQYDYSEASTTPDIETAVLTQSAVRFVVFGPAVNPAVTVGDNAYQVNVEVPVGGYLTVDGREKTIMLTLADGSTQNAFEYGVRGSGLGSGNYIFEPVKPGLQAVSWDGSFGFDFGWYEEEGEPPWSLS